MVVIGVTGGIGSGKTAVTDEFSKFGIAVVDADIAARTVVEAGKPALEEIALHFGKDILLPSGELDRAALRGIIFKQPEQRVWLEKLTHPLIREEIITGLKQAKSPYVILASPLLIESNQYKLTHRVLVVDTPEELQIRRTVKRDNNNEEQVRSIINAQSSREKRLSFADDIVVNDQDLSYLRSQVNVFHERYLKLSQDNES
ncbi:MAG: dephospho-CoA kinase [Bermanella sp.]